MLDEVTLLVSEQEADALSDALMEKGVLSVAIEDADAGLDAERPLFGEPGLEPDVLAWNRSLLKILVEKGFDIAAALQDACEELALETPALIKREPVPDADWVRLTQAQFKPICVSERLWIVPSWSNPPVEGAINIRLDPGIAFGTGSHPTTHLCLQWLEGNLPAGATVLDYGCGTGILAIASAMLGAKAVEGCDIDEQAVESARFNAQGNGVDGNFQLPDDLTPKTYDVVVANILANPLKMLAPSLVSKVAKGGKLILSGILDKQADEMLSFYSTNAPDMTFRLWKTQDGWVALEGSRPE